MSNLTHKDDSRFTLFPIKYQNIWKSYKDAEAAFWTAEEIDLSEDIKYFQALNDGEKHFLTHVLAFFSSSDGLVAENLCTRFYNDVGIPEARAFYAYQAMIEQIHSEVYASLIDTYVKDSEEKHKLFNAIETIPIIKKKADWAKKWISSQDSFLSRLIAFSVIEGVFFCSSFASIFYLKKRGLMPANTGLSTSNLLISRDESAHCDFACLLYKESDEKLSKEQIISIVQEGVDIELEFVSESLPSELIGMNNKLMQQYVKFVADRLLQSLGCEKIYSVTNPFDFMEMISLVNRSNFFETRTTEYSRAAVGKKVEENKIVFDADF